MHKCILQPIFIPFPISTQYIFRSVCPVKIPIGSEGLVRKIERQTIETINQKGQNDKQ